MRKCPNRVLESIRIGQRAHIWVIFSRRIHFSCLFCIWTTLSPSKSGIFQEILSFQNLLGLKMTKFRHEDEPGCTNGYQKWILREKLPLTWCFGHPPILFNTRLVMIMKIIQKNYRILMISVSLKKNIAIWWTPGKNAPFNISEGFWDQKYAKPALINQF